MKRIILAALLALPTPAVAFDAAEALDTALRFSALNYARIRIGSDYCDIPDGEWLSYRTRILAELLKDPRIDILPIERHLDRVYEANKRTVRNGCDEFVRMDAEFSLKEVDHNIEHLRGLIRLTR